MDAKSKANFINSIVDKEELVCPDCGTKNKPDSKFCISCGKALAPAESSQPAAAPIEEAQAPAATVAPAAPAQQEKAEPMDAFALGLPEWSIEPPQVMVRRRR